MINKCIGCNVDLVEYNTLGGYCPNCFSVYANELPTDEELKTYYNQFNENYHGGGRCKGAADRQITYAETYLKLINKFAVGKSLIDVGSSNSPLPNLAHSQGYSVTVVDYIRPKNLDDGIIYIDTPLESITLQSDGYDVVTAFAVIEHTRQPLIALEKLVGLCKKQGTIIIYLPEIGHFSDINALGTSGWFSPPEHLNLLSRKCMDSLMRDLNCQPIYYSRFELNVMRFIVRYGIGLIEGVIGLCIKKINYKFWMKNRQKRISKFTGLSMFVYEKH